MDIRFDWRGGFDGTALDALHAEGFDHDVVDLGWRQQLERHSLGWVVAHDGGELVGFVNVAWDGGVHAFLLDTVVRSDRRHEGIGRRLVETAVEHTRSAGCEWLHVDFDPGLGRFYLDACGFERTEAGLIEL